MISPEWTFFWWVPPLCLIVMSVAMVATIVRLIRGPHIADRIVSLDLFATQVAGMVGIYAVARDVPVLLHVSVVIALVLFIGTVAFASYLEQGVIRGRRQ